MQGKKEGKEYVMKTQKHNRGELRELKVNIEKVVVDSLECMAKNINRPMDELVVVALKRFCSSHSDFLSNSPELD